MHKYINTISPLHRPFQRTRGRRSSQHGREYLHYFMWNRCGNIAFINFYKKNPVNERTLWTLGSSAEEGSNFPWPVACGQIEHQLPYTKKPLSVFIMNAPATRFVNPPTPFATNLLARIFYLEFASKNLLVRIFWHEFVGTNLLTRFTDKILLIKFY